MKSSLPTGQAGHEENLTQWDDYHSDLPDGQAGIPHGH